MGSWNCSNVCINAPTEKLEIVKQVCECLGIDSDDYFDARHSKSIDSGDMTYFGLEWGFRGTANDIYGFDVFPILYKLIGDIQVCDVDDSGSSYDDHVYIDGTMLDSAKKKKYFETIAFSEGEGTVGEDGTSIRDALPWSDLKDEIEEKAKSRGIEISWIENGDGISPDEDNDDFVDLCEEVFSENFSFWDSGRSESEMNLSEDDFRIDEEVLSKLKLEAQSRDYKTLVSLLENVSNL